MVNWTSVLASQERTRNVLRFASGELSRDTILRKVPTLRSFVRSRGATEARRISRKALRRRGLMV